MASAIVYNKTETQTFLVEKSIEKNVIVQLFCRCCPCFYEKEMEESRQSSYHISYSTFTSESHARSQVIPKQFSSEISEKNPLQKSYHDDFSFKEEYPLQTVIDADY